MSNKNTYVAEIVDDLVDAAVTARTTPSAAAVKSDGLTAAIEGGGGPAAAANSSGGRTAAPERSGGEAVAGPSSDSGKAAAGDAVSRSPRRIGVFPKTTLKTGSSSKTRT